MISHDNDQDSTGYNSSVSIIYVIVVPGHNEMLFGHAIFKVGAQRVDDFAGTILGDFNKQVARFVVASSK
jgi:hypothetical protein